MEKSEGWIGEEKYERELEKGSRKAGGQCRK